jgi:hypothetical protein
MQKKLNTVLLDSSIIINEKDKLSFAQIACVSNDEEQEIISILDNLTFDDREIVDIREYDCDI